MGLAGTEPLVLMGILLEITGFVMLLIHEKKLLAEIQEKMNPAGPSPTHLKFRIIVFLRWNMRAIGIYFVLFGLVLQGIALFD